VQRYRFLKHTADAKFQAFGRTLEEAFSNTAIAMVSLMWDWEKIEKRENIQVEAEGKDLKQLLVIFLEEAIYLLDTKNFLLSSAERVKIERRGRHYLLRALFKGDRYSDKYKIFGNVKAITYNEMKIKSNDFFMIQVVVDI